MAKTALNTLKQLFKTGLKPDQSAFWNWMDSFWHKDEKISLTSLDGLQDELDKYATKDYVDNSGGTGGSGIKSATIDANGDLIITLSDDSTLNAGNAKGADATHYGAPLQSTAELAALTEYTDKQRHYVENDLSDYFYDAQATSGDIAPTNQVGGIGWWRKVAVGGETAASIKAKYESNPDTNAYTNADKSKLASITAIFTTELKSAYDAAASWVSTNGSNVLSNITELFSRWTDSASTGFVKFDVEAGDCHSVTGSTFNLLKSGYGRIKGTKVTFAAQSVAFPASYGLVYAKINSAGVLVTGGSVDYATEFPLFYLFTGVSGTYYVALESHNFNFNTNVSGFLNKAIGVQIVGSGGNVVVANTNTQVAISGNAELLDHGLSADITDTAGVGVVWIQDYLNASGQWALNTLSANLSPKYNVAGTPTALDSGKFGVYRLYATKQDGNTNAARYLAIMDTTQYSNQNAAQAAINANTVAAASGALVSVEVAQIGFAIVRADGVVVSTTVSKQTLTMQSASGSAATAAGTSLIPFDGITATNVQDGLEQENAKAIHKNTANEYSTITEKTTFADADVFLMEDSAAGFAKKKWSFSSLKTALNLLYKPSTYYGEFKDEFLNIADGSVTVALKKSMVLGLSGVAGADLTSANNITFTLPTPIAGEFNQSVIYFKIGATIPTINHPANTLILGTFIPSSFSTVILTYDQIRTAASTWQRVLSVKKV